LISYWDTSESNNNTGTHPRSGLILPIGAHPEAMPYPGGGGFWSSRVQGYDSTFSLAPTDAIELTFNGQPSYHESQPGVRIFDDNNQYWNSDTPYAGVMNPHTGT
jgi:immune inhibitor A